MKVILLAAVTSLFSLSITPLHKSVARGGIKRLSDALSSLYTIPTVPYNNGNQNAVHYTSNNVITVCKHNEVALNIQSLKGKSFKIQNPHF